ncbi:hypothetical protein L873DRAFT_1767963 [Choiromyces venosus 120613-1]|uniref:Uncharacterized protein n=1 Tax=Choiromyces venosus 120613-1 TaxID=1336337 RepID=A0A3N4JLM2_9PEZI|nr:hypothetical protein L873DRAFT_1767963 [Choiromyces venosus 120613-1]
MFIQTLYKHNSSMRMTSTTEKQTKKITYPSHRQAHQNHTIPPQIQIEKKKNLSTATPIPSVHKISPFPFPFPSPFPNPQSPIPNPQSPIPNPQSPIPTTIPHRHGTHNLTPGTAQRYNTATTKTARNCSKQTQITNTSTAR